MNKNSLLAAALAFASFTALPALAQSTPVSPASPAPVQSSVQSDAHKTMDKTADKSMEKPTKDTKAPVQLTQHPAAPSKAASDSTSKSDPVTK